MKADTRARLNKINQLFYESVADEFDQTRSYDWKGWSRAVAKMDTDKERIAVLDIGCGNGRFLRFLDQITPFCGKYTGIDNNEFLLKQLKKIITQRFEVKSINHDFVTDGTPSKIKYDAYDLVVSFGFLHHIPGYKNRVEFVKQIYKLLEKKGMLILSFWQYYQDERFENKKVSWEEGLRNLGVEIDQNDIEAGDVLLNWSNDKRLLRYCHMSDDEEVNRIVKQLQFTVVDDFKADGRGNNLNRYIVIQKAPQE